MFSWIEFLMANALTTVNAKPIAGIMSRAGGVLVGDYALLAAASVLGLLPGAVLMVFMRNHLAEGFSMGRLR
jgi:glycerol transport system permease protein